MIPSHLVRTSITLLVVSFLIWAWPAKGPSNSFDENNLAGDLVTAATARRLPDTGVALASAERTNGFFLDSGAESMGQDSLAGQIATLKIIDNGLETSIAPARFWQPRSALGLADGRALAAISEQGLLVGAPSEPLKVKDLLETLGYKIAKEDVVFPALNEGAPRFGSIIIKRAPGVVIRHDGKKEKVKTKADTIERLLAEKKIKLGKDDRVEPKLSSKIVPNLQVKVIRVEFKEEEIKEEIAYKINIQDDPGAYRGEESVKVAGQAGTRLKKYKITLEDGREVKRDLIDEQVLKEAVTKIILRGTKARPAYNAPAGSGDYWDLIKAAATKYSVDAGVMHSIMMCESGGRPDADNGYNKGLFQFDPGTFASWNIFPGAGIWDPKAQIYAAANLLAHGGRGQWAC